VFLLLYCRAKFGFGDPVARITTAKHSGVLLRWRLPHYPEFGDNGILFKAHATLLWGQKWTFYSRGCFKSMRNREFPEWWVANGNIRCIFGDALPRMLGVVLAS